MQFSMKVTGSAAVQAAIKEAIAKRKALANAAIAKAAYDCQAQAQQNAAVRTGFMRNSIHVVKVSESLYRVVVGAHYGLFVEMGTHRQAAQPFLFPAYVQTSKALLTVMQRIAAKR